jgi:protoheme IX farnesyltransferase
MIVRSEAVEFDMAREGRRVADFVALTKPRVVVMVLVTTAVGFYVAAQGSIDALRLLSTLLGTALAAGGTMTLNQYFERDLDQLMERTRQRPLPAGRLDPADAAVFGVAMVVAGLAYLAVVVNPASALVTATISLSYLFAYTPLKRVSPVCTIVGAVPGALPPVIGWVAVRGSMDIEAWVLFAIMFLWQLPHSLAIAAVYAEDYGRADIRLLPVVEPDGRSTARHIVSNSVALFAVGLLPWFVGLAGTIYLVVAIVLGLAFVAYGFAYARRRDLATAKNVVFASLLYLPLLLAAMAIDKIESGIYVLG